MGKKRAKKKSKYKGVCYAAISGWMNHKSKRWKAKINEIHLGYFKTEKEAAIAVDRYLILNGKSPVNILKKKT